MMSLPELRVQFTKRADGNVVLRCLRSDGSSTWQRHEKHAQFFSFHDLSHFAVETTLGYRSGFYGLIADGWDIADTAGKGARGKLPGASVVVEHVVGLLERERAGGAVVLAAEDFNRLVDEKAGPDPERRPLSDAQLRDVRNRIAELHRQWAALPQGSTLELAFDRSTA
jgi:hypothetical protein